MDRRQFLKLMEVLERIAVALEPEPGPTPEELHKQWQDFCRWLGAANEV